MKMGYFGRLPARDAAVRSLPANPLLHTLAAWLTAPGSRDLPATDFSLRSGASLVLAHLRPSRDRQGRRGHFVALCLAEPSEEPDTALPARLASHCAALIDNPYPARQLQILLHQPESMRLCEALVQPPLQFAMTEGVTMFEALLLPAAETVTMGGQLPDAATRSALLAAARSQFPDLRDESSVQAVSANAAWDQHILRLLATPLRLLHKGELRVEGLRVSVRGEVASEAERQQLSSALEQALGPQFTLVQDIRVSVREQAMIDEVIGQRVVEFESGQASLTPNGQKLLDQILSVLLRMPNRRVVIIGHTDNAGSRNANLALSQARAEAVRDYVTARGIQSRQVSVSGEGPDRPIAYNKTAEGRARNRRIEFKVLPL